VPRWVGGVATVPVRGGLRKSWEAVELPIRFLHAQWSIGVGSAPAYPPELVDLYAPRTVDTRLLPEADHAATIMTHRGAAVVAEMIKAALRMRPDHEWS
jgi:hypothetical protein